MKRIYRDFLSRLLASPLTYLISGAFIVFSILNFLVLNKFFSDQGTSDLHRFFNLIPYICILVIPALGSFLSFTKEDQSLPFSSLEIALGKCLSIFTVAAFSLILTLVLPMTVSFFGKVEASSVICGYSGLLLYLAATSSFSILIYTWIDSTGFAFILQALVLALVNGIHLFSSYVPSSSFMASIVKSISFAWHFDAAGKGILDSRDIVYYLAVTTVLVAATTAVMELKRGGASPFLKKTVILVTTAFLLLTGLSGRVYLRADTTSSKKFSVSRYSRSIIEELEEPMSITYYRNSSLKNLYPQVRDMEDFLKSFADTSPKISYTAMDPIKEKVTDKLSRLGVQGQRVQSTVKDTTSFTTVYSAVVVSYLGMTQTIPFVLSASNLEYSLAEKLDILVRNKSRTVQLVIGNGLSLEEDYSYIRPWLDTQGFSMIRTYLPSEMLEGKKDLFTLHPDLPLVVLGTALFTQEDAQALMNFVRGNGKAYIATSPYTVDIKNSWSVLPVEDYVIYGLQEFGLYYRRTITSDKENFSINLLADNSQGTGLGQMQNQTVSYPLWPALRSQDMAINGLTSFWPSAIDCEKDLAKDDGFQIKPMLFTSESAWQTETVQGKFMTNPFTASKKPEEGEEVGKFNLGATISRTNEKSPCLIVVGDQYSCTAQMIGYSSNQSAIDTRGLDFLTDGLLRLSGEDGLLSLKNSSRENSSLYKVSLDKLYGLRFIVTIMDCLVPVLILWGIFVLVERKRKNLSKRFLK